MKSGKKSEKKSKKTLKKKKLSSNITTIILNIDFPRGAVRDVISDREQLY